MGPSEFIQSFKLGSIQLFGIFLPGLLIMIFSIIGFAAPFFFLVYLVADILLISPIADSTEVIREILSFLKDNKLWVLLIFFILSYIAGYIIRLSTPDDLDEISGKKVLKKMEKDGLKILIEKDLKGFWLFGQFWKINWPLQRFWRIEGIRNPCWYRVSFLVRYELGSYTD